MYLSGTNILVHDNVCRFNFGGGISFFGNAAGSGIDKAQVYNNILYGNYGLNTVAGAQQQLGFNCVNNPGGTNPHGTILS